MKKNGAGLDCHRRCALNKFLSMILTELTTVNHPSHSTTGLPKGKAHRPWSISTWATQTDLLIAWCQTCVCQNGLAKQARLYKVHQSQPQIYWQLSQCCISLLDQTSLLISPQVPWPKRPNDRKNFILEGLLGTCSPKICSVENHNCASIIASDHNHWMSSPSQPMRPSDQWFLVSPSEGNLNKSLKLQSLVKGSFCTIDFGHIYCIQAVNCEDARCMAGVSEVHES